jgi:hypothetical protein
MCKIHDGQPELGRLSRLRKSEIKGLLVASSTVRSCATRMQARARGASYRSALAHHTAPAARGTGSRAGIRRLQQSSYRFFSRGDRSSVQKRRAVDFGQNSLRVLVMCSDDGAARRPPPHSDLKVSATAVDDESCQDNEKDNCGGERPPVIFAPPWVGPPAVVAAGRTTSIFKVWVYHFRVPR